MRVVHFVGFRGEEYWSAVKAFGRPHMIHMGWDRRAQRDIGEEDLVVFATGDEHQPMAKFNYPDIKEPEVIGAVDNPDVFRALEKGSAK